ncbi:DNA polymerase sliding clamp [Halorussus marinus]|uniref:DNA polymerase sliding clamp n=1 Tax=Halorussus marinus TaxID=2505976 RepID=UPI00109239A8|nr:DNA polymerase sliding clamp [Halorussus marinus]
MTTAIVSVDTIQEFIDPVSALVDECKLHWTPDGFEIRAVDPANVAMTHTRLSRDAFESYTDADATLGIPIDDLEDVLKFAGSNELLHIDYVERQQTLDLQAGGLNYDLGLIDPGAIRQEPEIPELDLPGEFVLEGEQLSKYADAADMVDDKITLGFDLDSETLYADGIGDTNSARYAIPGDDLIMGSCPEEVASMYSLDYLSDMVGVIDDDAEVRLELGSDYPCLFAFDIVEGHGNVRYQLAPRIATED